MATASASAPQDLDFRFPGGPVTTALDFDQASGLEPGTEGWWPVMAARAFDIQPGDRVLKGWADDDGIKRHAEFEVVEPAPWGDLRDSCRARFLTTTGQFASVGMLQPMALLRKGTHRTLAASIR